MSVASELEKLAGLLREGLVTREEFDEQKRVLMSNATNASNPSLGGGSSSSIGKSLGAYNILGTVGRGGMGVVYRARHRSGQIASRQGGDVALKVLHAQYSQEPNFQERFEREATLGLKLNHAGIVKVHDLIVDGGTLALAMELVNGQELSDLIGKVRGPIPWREAVTMFDGLLGAVSHAHGAGVIHRDLKPENIMVCKGGELKVLDFGIARDESSGKTKTGTGMGTVDYMAPEQYTDASKVDARADIYALGMTLYEMVAGRLPWAPEATEFEVLNAKASGNLPPPTQFYPDIPPELVSVIAQAMDVDLSRRCQSADAFGSALNGVIRSADAAAKKARKEEDLKAKEAAGAAKKASDDVAQLSELVVPETEESSKTPSKRPKSVRMWLGLVSAIVFIVGVIEFVSYTDRVEKAASAELARAAVEAQFSMVEIPGGQYLYGCATAVCGANEERQAFHTVHSFLMMKTEVTQGQYRAVTGETPSSFSDCGDDCPVETVTWLDAVKFANALSNRAGLAVCYDLSEGVKAVAECGGYRLPTEVEWEVAANVGSAGVWGRVNSAGRTHPVGSLAHNDFGIYDLYGNVWEWTTGSLIDPNSRHGSDDKAIIKGGSWKSGNRNLRVPRRMANLKDDKSYYMGFRLVRSN